jgi:hypothetical protein
MPARGFYVVLMLALGLGGGDLAAAKTGDVLCRSCGAGVLHAPVCLLRQANTVVCNSYFTAMLDCRSVVAHCHRILTVTSSPPLRTLNTKSQTLSTLIKIPTPLILQLPTLQALSLFFPFLSAFPQKTRSCDVVRLGKNPFACGPISFEAETKPAESRTRPCDHVLCLYDVRLRACL